MARIDDYRPYIEAGHREAFEGWARSVEDQRDRERAFFHAECLSAHEDSEAVRAGGM